ncbi:hypothetical protein IAT40_001355 [Kwoniella sp. CBS 6097]
MYTSTHQRSSSNPRAYTATDPLSGRRDDTAGQSMYGGDDSYGAYQHAGGYSNMSNVGYGGYSSGVNLAGYGTTSSPSAPSGSRRASGPKHNTPPQASTSAANPSPSSRYYQTAQTQSTADASGHHQSPYQPSSAPPQVLNHHHSGMGSQPQTAHPYAGQYHGYYDQHQGQWANYPATASQGYAQQQSAPPRSSTTQSTTTPTVPQSTTLGDSHQQQQQQSSHRSSITGSSAYDYAGASGAYQSWPPHDQSRGSSGQQQPQQSWQQAPQTGSSRSSQSQGSQAAMMQQGGWQGYGGHPSMSQTMPPHHMASAHMPPGGQYGWQQQWGSSGYGYPPAPAPHTQPVHAQPAQSAPAPAAASTSNSAAPPTGGKKSKKEKHDKAAADKLDAKAEKAERKAAKAAEKAAEKAEKAEKKHKKEKSSDYKGLGKRHVESSTEEEADGKKEKKRKGKKHEEEKPAPKAPAKSHLHPPRQAQSAWQLFFTDELNKAKAAAAQGNSPGGTPHHAKLNVAQIAKDAGTAYANLNEEQKKYYAQKVIESKEQYVRELAVWQATLTPEDIKAENAFRAQQRKEGKSRKGNLKDPNAPKKPLSAYFLFLKGIRENDDIRAKVWGEESETTKQSVLAAERWRSLSDEEKKPYLQQAEHDKQEYEAARKIYEDDAAARARGEVPSGPAAGGSDPVSGGIKGEENNNDGESGEHHYPPHFPSSDPVKPSPSSSSPVNDVNHHYHHHHPSTEPNFPGFQQDDSRGSASNIPASGQGEVSSSDNDDDEFQGFTDPLEEMELSGIEGMAKVEESHEPQWDELQRLMGTTDDGYDERTTGGDAEGVSVAPALSEAAAGSTDLQPQPGANEAQVQQIAAQAEGLTAVPQLASSGPGSGVPTEAVNELPPAGAAVADAIGAEAGSSETEPHSQGFSNLPAADGV